MLALLARARRAALGHVAITLGLHPAVPPTHDQHRRTPAPPPDRPQTVQSAVHALEGSQDLLRPLFTGPAPYLSVPLGPIPGLSPKWDRPPDLTQPTC